jgi:transcriptional regulator with XRE-family HTH domain
VQNLRGSSARDAAASRSRWLAYRFGQELRIARVSAGLSQVQLANRAGVTQTVVSRAERGLEEASLRVRCRLAAAAGHELGWRLYPVASVRLRDSGQLAIAQAIATQCHESWGVNLEVPVSAGDLRAADLLLAGATEVIHIEIERALIDVQAQLRAAQLKRTALASRDTSDARPTRLVIAVPDTQTARRRLAPVEELLSRQLPGSSRQIWDAIRSGSELGRDGLLFVRARIRGG